MEIYLIRHGESTGNYEKKYVGWTDVELSAKGKIQSTKLKENLLGIEFDAIYSSDLKRAYNTAKSIFPEKDISENKNFREINFGKFENLRYDDILLKYPEEILRWTDMGDDYIFPGGESSNQLYERVVRDINKIISKDFQRVIIFAHGGVIRSILSYFMYGNNNECWKFAVENCKINIIEHSDKYSFLKCLNA